MGVFNRYADNIYLAKGDDRANAYLGGGATPSSLQTVQYMLRNDLLTNLDNITQELEYLLRCIKEGQSPADLETKELETCGRTSKISPRAWCSIWISHPGRMLRRPGD